MASKVANGDSGTPMYVGYVSLALTKDLESVDDKEREILVDCLKKYDEPQSSELLVISPWNNSRSEALIALNRQARPIPVPVLREYLDSKKFNSFKVGKIWNEVYCEAVLPWPEHLFCSVSSELFQDLHRKYRVFVTQKSSCSVAVGGSWTQLDLAMRKLQDYLLQNDAVPPAAIQSIKETEARPYQPEYELFAREPDEFSPPSIDTLVEASTSVLDDDLSHRNVREELCNGTELDILLDKPVLSSKTVIGVDIDVYNFMKNYRDQDLQSLVDEGLLISQVEGSLGGCLMLKSTNSAIFRTLVDKFEKIYEQTKLSVCIKSHTFKYPANEGALQGRLDTYMRKSFHHLIVQVLSPTSVKVVASPAEIDIIIADIDQIIGTLNGGVIPKTAQSVSHKSTPSTSGPSMSFASTSDPSVSAVSKSGLSTSAASPSGPSVSAESTSSPSMSAESTSGLSVSTASTSTTSVTASLTSAVPKSTGTEFRSKNPKTSVGNCGLSYRVKFFCKDSLCCMIENVEVSVKKGDITKVTCDAVVNPVDSMLHLGGNVAQAIRRANDPSMSLELREVIRRYGSRTKPYVQKATGQLKAQGVHYVIHTISPTSRNVSDGYDCNAVSTAVYNALCDANDHKCSSLALPAISSGLGGISIHTCTDAYWKAIKKFVSKFQQNYLKEIWLVNIDDRTNGHIVYQFKQLLDKAMDRKSKTSRTLQAANQTTDTNEHREGNEDGREFNDHHRNTHGKTHESNHNGSKPDGNYTKSRGDYRHTYHTQDKGTSGSLRSKGRPDIDGSESSTALIVDLKQSSQIRSSVNNNGEIPDQLEFGGLPGKSSHTESATGSNSDVQKQSASSVSSEGCSICMDVMSSSDSRLLPCKHRFHNECMDGVVKVQKSNLCPICKTPFATPQGPQPKGGSMDVHFNREHPKPGQHYNGTSRTAYLPDNPQGQKVYRLLRKAFDAGLIFNVGRSITTGMDDQVVWNDIHHKTNFTGPYGYPDPSYLASVEADLLARGITE